MKNNNVLKELDISKSLYRNWNFIEVLIVKLKINQYLSR